MPSPTPPQTHTALGVDASRSSARMWLSAWMVVAVFMLSNTATPLYVHWQQQIGFTSGTLTVIFAAYILGLLGTLLLAGQLSDRFGRKVVLIPGMIAAIAAALLFEAATSVGSLLVARLLTGVAVGVIVSAGMASIVDNGGPERRKLSSLTASMAMVLGAGLGPILAGAIAQVSQQPVTLIFSLELLVLVSAFAVAWMQPNRKKSTGVQERFKIRLPSVPRANRLQVLLGIAFFGPGITATSFVLSLGPSLLSSILHISSPLVAGGTACVMFMAALGVQFLVRHLAIQRIFYLSAFCTFAAMTGVVTSILFASAPLLIAAAILAGAAQGLGQLGGLTLIALHVPDNRRAEANSVLNLGGYIPAGVLPVCTGVLIDHTSLATGAFSLALVLAAAAVFAAMLVAKKARSSL